MAPPFSATLTFKKALFEEGEALSKLKSGSTEPLPGPGEGR